MAIIYRVGTADILIDGGLVSEVSTGTIMMDGREHNLGERENNAYHLLMEYLDEEQRKSYREKGWFRVVSQHGNAYSLGMASTVKEGTGLHRSPCIVLHGYPHHDAVLARKLMLETNEDLFVETACW